MMNEYQNLLKNLREILDMKPGATESQVLEEVSDLIKDVEFYRESHCGCCY
jgi:predicted adenine nucleotide alpha hydrolase (AANH) superfamily ATPase